MVSILIGGMTLALVGQEVQISKSSFLSPYFKEPYEKFIFVFSDDTAIHVTSGDEARIDIGATWLSIVFKKLGRKIEEIVLIIHSHVTPDDWSGGDRGFVRDLRTLGYKGPALLFMPGGFIRSANF